MPGAVTYLLRLLPVLLCHIATIWTPSVRAANARLLIYSATRGYRHDSIPIAIDVLKKNGPSIDATFDATEDESQFQDQNLAKYDAVIFLSTTGKGDHPLTTHGFSDIDNVEVLSDIGPFQRYIDAGGNFVGIHAAADTLPNSEVYIKELGSTFASHPTIQSFTLDNLEPTHPSVTMLPKRWTVVDEAYNFKRDPRGYEAKVVLAADETTYKNVQGPFNQGTPHPMAWYQERGAGVQSGGIAGRSFYTALGHRKEMWNDNLFVEHVLGGISWVLQSKTTRAFNSTAQVGNPQRLVETTTQSGITQSTGNPEPSSSSVRSR